MMENIKNNSSVEITKSEITKHHFSEREKKDALEVYGNVIDREVQKINSLNHKYLEQLHHKNLKSNDYDFALFNQLSFDREQCKRRILFAWEDIKKKYNADIELPDLDNLIENYENYENYEKEE